MSCKKIEMLLIEALERELTTDEQNQITQHLDNCSACSENAAQDTILSNIIKESSDVDDQYIISQEIMRSRVETQLASDSNKHTVIYKYIPAMLAALVVFTFTMFHNSDNSFPNEYSVDIDGVDISLVEGDEDLCEMFYTNGLPEASFDIIGCDTTCKLVIFDLKSQKEAEKVIRIINKVNEEKIKTKINKLEQYNIS